MEMLIWLFAIIGVVWLDQLAKWLVVTYLPDEGISIIDGVFRLTYVENRGAAFGMLANQRWIFIVITLIALTLLSVYLFWKRPKGTVIRMSLAFIIGGGIGNMIDRIFIGYVVDFLDFCAFPSLWKWVFNIADAFVCVGAALLMIYLIMETVKDVRAEKAAKAAAAEGVVATTAEDKPQTSSADEVKAQSKDEKDNSDIDS